MDLMFVRQQWRVRRSRVIDAGVAGLFFALMAAELALRSSEPGQPAATWWAYALAVVITAPIAGHRRRPITAAVVAAVGIVVYSAGHFVAFPGYAAFALAFVTSLHTGRHRGLISSAVLAVALGIALATQSEVTVTASTWISSALAFTVAWLAGENLRIRDTRWALLRERTRRIEAEREEKGRQAIAAERLRIARELHDVVAHSMSVVAVQAGVAHHVIDARPEVAKAAMATVETATRAALVEMRRLLGVLRQEGESSASLAPAPTLADVPDLIERFAEVDLPVDFAVEGPAPLRWERTFPRGDFVHLSTGAIPDGVALSAFRIIQEGLTNVLRHGGPRARLRLGYEPGQLRIVIADDGPDSAVPRSQRIHHTAPEPSTGEQPSTGQPSTGEQPSTPRQPSTLGHGLLGMRERVAVFGGTFEAGQRHDGGFQIAATLPYDRPAEVPGSPATERSPATEGNPAAEGNPG
jgi:signal transduction histidine kinase